MKVNFFNQTNNNTKTYEKLILSIFKNIKKKKIFNIIFVSKEEIQNINKTYRNIDAVTDVISFALNDTEELSNMATNELGDIFICLDKCIEQSQEYGHSVSREIGFMAVHGYLHLCGYDHLTEEDEEKMTKLQEKILDEANLKR